MFRISKRVLNFDKQDWKHIIFLFTNMIKQWFLMDYNESKDAWIFLKLHFTHDSDRHKGGEIK